MRQSDFHAYIFRGLWPTNRQTLKTTACQGPLFFWLERYTLFDCQIWIKYSFFACLNFFCLKYAERFAIVGDTSRGEWHLRISHVTPADNGRYACQLHSGNGDAAADVLVRVEPQERSNEYSNKWINSDPAVSV